MDVSFEFLTLAFFFLTLLRDALGHEPLAAAALAFGSGGMAVVGGGAT